MREYLLFGGDNNLYYKQDHKNRTNRDISLQIVFDIFKNNRSTYSLDMVHGILINRGYIIKDKYILESYLSELVNKRYIYQIEYSGSMYYCDVFTYFKCINNEDNLLENPIYFRMPYNDLCLFRNKSDKIRIGELSLITRAILTEENIKGVNIINFDIVKLLNGLYWYQIDFDIRPNKKLFLKRNTNFIKTMKGFTGKVDNSKLYYSIIFNLSLHV